MSPLPEIKPELPETPARRGDWIQTFTGRKFWPLDPRPEDVCIEDIAHALALKCRYTGHCHTFYSVGQHSYCVSYLVPAEDALWGLLHDAAEAYLPDVARPLKKDMPDFHVIEALVMAAICEKFGLQPEQPASVSEADALILGQEKRDLMTAGPSWGPIDTLPTLGTIIPWPWQSARANFIARFNELTRK
ncbi:MAG: phosphohydrolase [Betaproteobacteria bacterium]